MTKREYEKIKHWYADGVSITNRLNVLNYIKLFNSGFKYIIHPSEYYISEYKKHNDIFISASSNFKLMVIGDAFIFRDRNGERLMCIPYKHVRYVYIYGYNA